MSSSLLPVPVLAGLLVLLAAPPAQAARCSDFPNQAAAQRAANTVDADGDGIYCETLPCPCSREGASAPPAPPSGGGGDPDRRRVRVVSVVDGDTLRVRLADGRRRAVRLIGIDTPEMRRSGGGRPECGAREATAALRRLTLRRDGARRRGRTVVLVRDPTQDAVDRFGRLLAYVETTGGADLGRALVRRGWADVFVYRGVRFQRAGAYERDAAQARRAGAGRWTACR
jgi:endonuclease YncB( thermonuclease family)